MSKDRSNGVKMHELFMQVIKYRDLSRAGDLFSIPDSAIVKDLTTVLNDITLIVSQPDYVNNSNDQSVVEICVTRITSCIRETDTVEQHCDGLVDLLESCLHHNLISISKDEDSPHAKISSDIISCIFLNYGKKSVMQRVLPVAVMFLHRGNHELSRNMASYLSLAAIEHAALLAPHVETIMDALISGNYLLCRVLATLYEVAPDQVQEHVIPLVTLLPHCDTRERLDLLHLFSVIAMDNPSLLEASVPQLCEYLSSAVTAKSTLEIFLRLAKKRPSVLVEHLITLKMVAQRHPQVVGLVAQIVGAVGKLSKDKAQDALNFVLEQLPKADGGSQGTLIREATLLCSSYPVLFTDKVLAGVRRKKQASSSKEVTSGPVTIVKVGLSGASHVPPVTGYTKRTKFGDSRSTGRLHAVQNIATHRSMTKLNNVLASSLHKSLTKLSSSQQLHVCGSSVTSSPTLLSQNVMKRVNANRGRVYGEGNSTLPLNSIKMQRPLSQGPLNLYSNHITVNKALPHAITVNNNRLVDNNVSVFVNSALPTSNQEGIISANNTAVSRRFKNTSITFLNQNNSNPNNTNNGFTNRISVFEPYPMRDTIQHFCEKHLEKIRLYMEKISIRIPSPVKCTIEERRQKKSVKLHFACQGNGKHCLYAKSFFSMRTRNPRTWIHLMFISLQAQHSKSLCSRDSQVASLRHCWDTLKYDNKTFVTLVTGAFPCAKDQELLIQELRHAGYFDVFQICQPISKSPDNIAQDITVTNYNAETTKSFSDNKTQGSVMSNTLQSTLSMTPSLLSAADANTLNNNSFKWGCFLCAHPERAAGFLTGNTHQPVIEGQLKEKKGRWRLFKRWRTRYFTLSGAQLSCRGSRGESIDVTQIQSVKISRGSRNIPKAFEIFTGDQTLILKPKDGKNAEEWVQCLSLVVAHSHSKDVSPVTKSHSLPNRGTTVSPSSSRTAL